MEFLDLSRNQIEKFVLTKPLGNLKLLVLDGNHLTTFSLDQKEMLPNIQHVDLSRNQIKQLEIIDDITHLRSLYRLKTLKLDDNYIQNTEAYALIFQNKKRTSITGYLMKNNLPVCDCKSKPLFEKMQWEDDFIDYSCIKPYPDRTRISFDKLDCEATRVEGEKSCEYYEGT